MTYCDLLDRGALCITVARRLLEVERLDRLYPPNVSPEVLIRHIHSPISAVTVQYDASLYFRMFVSRTATSIGVTADRLFYVLLFFQPNSRKPFRCSKYDGQTLNRLLESGSDTVLTEPHLNQILFDIAVEAGLMPF